MSLDESVSSDDSYNDQIIPNTDKYYLRIERELASVPKQTSTLTIYNKITFSLFSILDFNKRLPLDSIVPIEIMYLIIQNLYYYIIKPSCFEKECLSKWWEITNDRYLCQYEYPNIQNHCSKIFNDKKCHSIHPVFSGDKCYVCKKIACMNCMDHTIEQHMDYSLRSILIRDEYHGYDYKSLGDISQRKILKEDEHIWVFICIQCITNMLNLLGYNTIHLNDNTAFLNRLLTRVIQEKLDPNEKYRSLVLIIKAIKLDPNKIWKCDKNQ